MSDRSCEICGKRKFRSREGHLRDFPNIGVVECVQCGVVTPESSDGIVIDYGSGTMHGSLGVDVQNWRAECSEDDKRRANWLLEQFWFKGKVLDFGCGAGGLLSELKLQEIPAYGVELDSAARQELVTEGFEVYADVDQIPETTKSQTEILMLFHVLEHMPKPKDTLKDLLREFPNLHRIIIEVPSANDALLNGLFAPAFSEFTYWSHHAFLHTPASLRLLLEDLVTAVELLPIQRYGLANHIGWWRDGIPNGASRYPFLEGSRADVEYRIELCASGMSDTLIAICQVS